VNLMDLRLFLRLLAMIGYLFCVCCFLFRACVHDWHRDRTFAVVQAIFGVLTIVLLWYTIPSLWGK